MRTFENEKTARFWTIQREKKKVTVRYGKLGGKTTERSTDCRNAESAMDKYQSQIREKVRDGYAETTTDDAPTLDPIGQALEAALTEDPDDLAAHMAFADWLSEQPDPRHQDRGEFVRLQLQLEDESLPAAQRKKLQKREKELLVANERRWVGWRFHDALYDGGGGFCLAKNKPDQIRGYRRGWLEWLTVPVLTEEFANTLKVSPAVRLLRRLTVQDCDYDEKPLTALAGAATIANVRALRIDEWPENETVTRFVADLSRLEELHLQGFDTDIGDLFSLRSLTNLRQLHVAGALEYDIQALATNPSLGKLEGLALLPELTEEIEDGALIALDDVRAIAHSPHLGSLRHLVIHRTDAGDEGVREIITSGLLARLTELDLSNGCITDEGARLLAAAPDYRHLKKFTVVYNRLTRAGITVLRNKKVTLTTAEQQEPLDDGTYLDDYLYDVDDFFDDEYDFDEDWE